MPLRRAIVLGALGVLFLGSTADGATAASQVPPTVRGALTFASRHDWTRVSATGCRGRGLYGDVEGGTALTVSDGTGRVLLRTTLRPGHRSGGCRFAFVLRKLPPSPLYHLVVGPARNIVFQDLFTPNDPRLEAQALDFTIRSSAPV